MAPPTNRSTDLFENFQASAFRLETLQTYTIPSEQPGLQAFLGGKVPPEYDEVAEWIGMVRGKVNSGKTMRRARVVRRPLTDYTRYSLSWGIPRNTEAGEDYHIIDLTDREIGLPEQDFWMFDDETVLLQYYNPDGSFRSRELADPADIDRYRKWRDLALSEAIPWSEYRLQRPPDGW